MVTSLGSGACSSLIYIALQGVIWSVSLLAKERWQDWNSTRKRMHTNSVTMSWDNHETFHWNFLPNSNPSYVICMCPRKYSVCAKRGNIISAQLPQGMDFLSRHAWHTSYPAGIWRYSFQCELEFLRPTDLSWTTDEEGVLEIQWMTGPLVPIAVLELMKC